MTKANKTYEQYKGFTEAMNLTADIIDLADCCQGDIQFGITNEETSLKLDEIIRIAKQVKDLIKEKELIEV